MRKTPAAKLTCKCRKLTSKKSGEIATIMNCDWRTVRKYVDMENFNFPAPQPSYCTDDGFFTIYMF